MRLFGKKIPNFGFQKLDFLVFRVRKKRFWSLMGVPSNIFWHCKFEKKFGSVRLFRKFLMSPKGPLHFFDILQQNGCQRASSVQIFDFSVTLEENT